jgi:hypothetical protein
MLKFYRPLFMPCFGSHFENGRHLISGTTAYWTEFHETWWSYRYMFLVGPKVFSFVVKSYFEGFKGGGGYYRILWESCNFVQTSWKFWKRRIVCSSYGDLSLCQILCLYHYPLHLEVININVRNFNFPIGFYSNPHPLWTPQNRTLQQSWKL